MTLHKLFLWLFFFTSTNIVFAQSTIFIKFNAAVSDDVIKNFLQNENPANKSSSAIYHAEKKRLWESYSGIEGLDRIIALRVESRDNSDALRTLRSMPELEYVQEGIVYRSNVDKNDSLYSSQWSLKKIKADFAWEISEGKDSVIIGVIDTGLDYLHPDLKNKIFFNPGENGRDSFGRDKSKNGVDDDGNGFVDDYFGWDFTDRVGFPFDSTGGDYLDWDNDPLDQNIYSHGTAVSGIIAAETNNNIGIAGVAPNVRILNLRAFDPDGFGEEDDVASAILYAVRMGAKVINMSFGDYSFSYVLRDVIRYAYSRGVVLVASSGNSNSTLPHYPSGYSEVISVGNSTSEDYVAGSSNYGSTLDLVAPGTSIITTIKNGRYSEFNGTSAAAPFVSAAAGLLLSIQNFTNEEVKQIIKSTADDIGTPGWDLRSGAGRLNVYKALKVLGPAAVRFNFPLQDFTTYEDTIKIIGTCLSPYFQSIQLSYGLGANPTKWNILVDNRQSQFSGELIYSLLTASIPDTIITLRLRMELINSGTLEERINIHVMRSTVKANIISIIPALYGKSPTVIAAGVTNAPSVMRMYYRKSGTLDFRFVTMDGFAVNNQFVKDLHFGFVPPGIMTADTQYDIYFEAEGLNGKTIKIQNGAIPFTAKTNSSFNLKSFYKVASESSPGVVYKDPIFLADSNSSPVIIKSPIDNSRTNYLLRCDSGTFTKIDSLVERIPRDYGDFNKNGKKDILTNWGRDTYFLEQESPGSAKFNTISRYEGSKYWPIFVRDFTNSGKNQLLAIRNDSTLVLADVNTDLTLSSEKLIGNFTPTKLLDDYTFVAFQTKYFEFPSAEVTDIDGNGEKELWMADADGDILCYNISANGTFTPDTNRSFRSGFFSSANYITSGDFNGDNKTDLAVLLHSIDEVDIADYNRLLVISFVNNKPVILFDHAFLDPATEFSIFTKRTYNSLRLVKLDSESGDELVLSMFPYSYVFKYQGSGAKAIYFDENVNSNVVFASDLTRNGAMEFGISTSSEFKVLAFDSATPVATPIITSAYSFDSNSVMLEWESPYSQFYIYKKTISGNYTLIAESNTLRYKDNNVVRGNTYQYYVVAINPPNSLFWSQSSNVISVYHHDPAKLKIVTVASLKAINVTFSEKMSNVISDLRAIFVIDSSGNKVYPNSITSSDQYSYLIAFKDNLPEGDYRLTSAGLRDLYKSHVASDTLAFQISSISIPPEFYVSSFKILNAYTVSIQFNLDVDTVSASVSGNYNISPNNNIASVSINPSDRKGVILSLSGGNPVGSVGKEYTLTVKNVTSSYLSGKIPINTGAGSSVILTSNKENLSDVFVYPSPVRVSNIGNNSLTFANLPRFSKIIIWNLAGDRIIELEERDGNGGVTWNLNDESGQVVNSGVYLYRITMLNSSGDETESKIGKFAVVK